MDSQKETGDDENDLSPLTIVTQVKSTCSFCASKRAGREMYGNGSVKYKSLSVQKVICNPHSLTFAFQNTKRNNLIDSSKET